MGMNRDSCGLRIVWCALRYGDYRPGESKSDGFLGTRKNHEVRKNLGNPNEHAGIGKKNPTGDPVRFYVWWSWGELNLAMNSTNNFL
jgi:hypothetical protein